MAPHRKNVEVTLEYTGEPQRGGFGSYPVAPRFTSELAIALRDHPELANEAQPELPENPTQLQVHVIGTSRALEELGRYLIGLARSETRDPEPYGSFDDVRNADGGTVRLLPRRVEAPAPWAPRSADYKSAVCEGE